MIDDLATSGSTFGVRCTERRTTNLERRTTNLERRTTNLERRTTNLERCTTNLERCTTNLERRTSNHETTRSLDSQTMAGPARLVRDISDTASRRAGPPAGVTRGPDARRGLFGRLGSGAANVLVISEGLVIYLMPAEVAALAEDLAAPESFRHWAVDIASPGLLDMLKQRMGTLVQEAGAPFLFAPEEGPAFFEPHGW